MIRLARIPPVLDRNFTDQVTQTAILVTADDGRLGWNSMTFVGPDGSTLRNEMETRGGPIPVMYVRGVTHTGTFVSFQPRCASSTQTVRVRFIFRLRMTMSLHSAQFRLYTYLS
jgi:hypothetical protein